MRRGALRPGGNQDGRQARERRGAIPGLWRGGMALALLAFVPPLRPGVTPPTGRLSGFVYDSLARTPLAGAHVQVVPMDAALDDVARRTVDTDSAGRFQLEALPAARYLVGFFHPRLDSLGIEPPPRRVDLRMGRDATVDLAVPSGAGVIGTWCGRDAARDDGAGVVLGTVRDAHTRGPVDAAAVSAQWSAITLGRGGARAGVQEATASTSAAGWFALCGVPRGAVVVLRTTAAADTGALLELDVPEHGVLLRDVAIERAATRPAGAPMTVHGRVRSGQGEALPGARVRLWGSDDEVRADARGEFRLTARAAGTQLVDARLIGFVPLRQVVDIVPDSGATVELSLVDFPMEIDTVRVRATRAPRDALAGFERRRRLGHGTFLDADAIELRRPLVFTDLVRGLPGVEVHTVDMMTREVRMRAANGEGCTPALIVDGMRLPLLGTSIDDIVPAELVKAVEVYPRRIQAPPEYQDADCGSVVVWTGMRGWLARKLGGKRASP